MMTNPGMRAPHSTKRKKQADKRADARAAGNNSIPIDSSYSLEGIGTEKASSLMFDWEREQKYLRKESLRQRKRNFLNHALVTLIAQMYTLSVLAFMGEDALVVVPRTALEWIVAAIGAVVVVVLISTQLFYRRKRRRIAHIFESIQLMERR